MSKIPDGAYVLATKFSDGNPGDPWAVGFLRRDGTRRFTVLNNDGVPIYRPGGFSRIFRISKFVGREIVDNARVIETSLTPMIQWKHHFERTEWAEEADDE